MKKIQWAAGIILAFAVMAVLLISSFEIAMYADFGVYEREYEKYDVLSDLDMSMEDTMYVTREMMAYLRGDREELSVITNVEGREQDFFNEQDRFHMGEVRDLFIGGLNIRLGAAAVAVICLIFLAASRADLKRILSRGYQIVLIVVGAAVAALGIAVAIDFNAVFVELDYMIRMLPEGLFADMVIRIGSIFVGSLVILLIWSMILGKHHKKTVKSN